MIKLGQKAVLWRRAALDRHGDQTVSEPEEIKCRWEHSTGSIIGPDNAPIAVSANIMVEIDVPIGSLLRLGKLRALPTIPDDLHEVVGFERIPDIKERDPQRNVVTRRWKERLPEVV